jgi:hypothetical protein
MPTYRSIMAQQRNRSRSRSRTPTDRATLVLAGTLLSSYFMAQGSDPDISSRSRMLYFMANGVSNLYVLQLLGTADFSFA